MKKVLEIYLMPNFSKWSDTKFRASLKTVKLTRLSSEMDKKCYENEIFVQTWKIVRYWKYWHILDNSEVIYQMNTMDAVSIILAQSTQTIGSKSWLYF